MSYTLTIDAPERAVCDPLAERKVRSVYSSRSVTVTPTELGEMFVAFLAERCHISCENPTIYISDYVVASDRQRTNIETGLDLFNRLRGKGLSLGDDEMHIFDRVKDYGRKVKLV